MSNEQVEMLVEVLRDLSSGPNGLDYFIQLIITVIGIIMTAGLSAKIAFEVAKKQIQNSNELQIEQQRAEIENQQRFMFDKLKLSSAEKLMNNSTRARYTVSAMIKLSVQLKDLRSSGVENIREAKNEILLEMESLKAKLIDYNEDFRTFTLLYNNESKANKFGDLKIDAINLKKKCFPKNGEFSKKEIQASVVKCKKTIREYEILVKESHENLIEVMRPNFIVDDE